MSATRKPRDNKITRLIVPYLYDNPGATINEVVDDRTGNPVEALYFYEAAKTENAKGEAVKPVIEVRGEPVRTGKRGRPANRWYLTKSARDAERKRRARAAKSQEPVATPEPALA